MNERKLVSWLTYKLLKSKEKELEYAEYDSISEAKEQGKILLLEDLLDKLGYIYPTICPDCGTELEIDTEKEILYCPEDKSHLYYRLSDGI